MTVSSPPGLATVSPLGDRGIELVIGRLADHGCEPRQSGSEWSARCPAHEDRNPSLRVREAEGGRVLVTCHAGCPWQSVLSALDLPELAIAPRLEVVPSRRTVATYRYEDQHGDHLYDVLRYEPKAFSQRPADGRRGAGAMQGVPRVPYRLPELLAAISAGCPVFICEGEKDVEAVRAAGAAATTNPEGAGKWRPEYSPWFAGADVMVVADRDGPGRRHALGVADELRPVAASVQVLQPPSRKHLGREVNDLSDHLGAGRGLAELEPLDPAPPAQDEREPQGKRIEVWTVGQLLTNARREIPCVVRGIMPEASLAFIGGPAKAGKTWWALYLALCIAAGRPVLGRFAVPAPRPVLYVAMEGHSSALRLRVGCLARGLDLDPLSDLGEFHLAYKPRGLDLADRGWAEELAGRAAELGAAVVVVDVLREATSIDENSQKEFGGVRDNLNLLLDSGCGVALLHHFGKQSEASAQRQPGERLSGTGAMRGAYDVGMFVTRDQAARTTTVGFELRDLVDVDPVSFELAGNGSGSKGGFLFEDACHLLVVDPDGEPAAGDPVLARAWEIHRFLAEREGRRATAREIATHLGCSPDSVYRCRELLSGEYGIEHVIDGRDSHYRVRLEDS